MNKTITIRMDGSLRRALEQGAREQGKSVLVVVREILTRALEDSPMSASSPDLRGTLDLGSQPSEPWRRMLAERN